MIHYYSCDYYSAELSSFYDRIFAAINAGQKYYPAQKSWFYKVFLPGLAAKKRVILWAEDENGIIVGIGNCTDEILVLNHPIAEHAFSDLWDSNFHTVIIQKGVTQIGDRAFSSCSFKEVYFLSEIPPQIGDDLFANTWNAYDFNIYVPFAGLNAYKNISAEYWDNAIPQIKGFEIKL